MENNQPIYVTRPYLPPLEEFIPYLEKIWSTRVLTNNSYFHNEFEKELCNYLQVNNLSLVTNGTTALLISLKALGIKGEVITTPYSFVATSHALMWSNLTPVFVDIHPETCNIDPKKLNQLLHQKLALSLQFIVTVIHAKLNLLRALQITMD